jgi:hypothetical protein
MPPCFRGAPAHGCKSSSCSHPHDPATPARCSRAAGQPRDSLPQAASGANLGRAAAANVSAPLQQVRSNTRAKRPPSLRGSRMCRREATEAPAGLRIQRRRRLASGAPQHVGINHRRAHIRMTQQLLHGAAERRGSRETACRRQPQALTSGEVPRQMSAPPSRCVATPARSALLLSGKVECVAGRQPKHLLDYESSGDAALLPGRPSTWV